MKKNQLAMAAALILTVGLFTSGCASKKYVKGQLDPVNSRIDTVGNKADANGKRIDEVDEQLSRSVDKANEKAMTAEASAKEAAQKADEAGSRADQAASKAESAETLAQHGNDRAATLETRFANLGNYKTVDTKTIQFALNQSTLSADAKSELDSAAAQIGKLNRYVLEVEGFTDPTGSDQYNLRLSQRRAESVVRYLATNHEIPLHRIYVIGLGDARPVGNNKTRSGRGENRRVEVRILESSDSGSAASVETSSNR